MIVTHEEVEALTKVVRRHLVSSKWISNMHRAMAVHGIKTDPKLIAHEIWEGLSPDEFEAARDPARADRDDILAFLHANLHLLIPCGFDEVRIEQAPLRDLAQAMDAERRKRSPDEPEYDWFQGARGAGLALSVGFRCRDTQSGLWFSGLALDYATQTLVLRSPKEERRFKLHEVVEYCERALRAPGHAAVMVLPNLWRPPETHASIELVDATRAILQALHEGKTTLSALTWQQLEDIVAELLRGRGLEVQVTPRRKDGGRDILARGELIPGEPTVLAVEVKHKGVTKLDDVRSRLYANRDFPALMFATSGRFSAGVVREKEKPENFLRLWLRDGTALGAWINEHAAARRG